MNINSSSLNEWNKYNTNFIENNNDDGFSNISSYEREINMEIYSDENIQINKEENLLYRKLI